MSRTSSERALLQKSQQRCALILCLFASQSPSPARAQTMLDFALEVEAPPDARCTAAAVLRHVIEERVGRLVFLDDPAPSRRIAVSIGSDVGSSSWSADIVMRDERGEVVGERHVTEKAAACDGLDEALVVVISTLIGIADQAPAREPARARAAPDARNERSANPRRREPVRAPPPTPVVFVSTEAGTPRSHFELAASVAARADLGLLPGLAPGVAVGVDLDFGAWAVAIGAMLLPPTAMDLGDGAAASFLSTTGNAGLCLDATKSAAATLALCAGVEAGLIAVRTSGLEASVSRVEPLVRGLLGPRLRVGIGPRLGLLVGAEAALPLFSPHYFLFDVSGERQYYHSVGFGISAQIGIYWLFSS